VTQLRSTPLPVLPHALGAGDLHDEAFPRSQLLRLALSPRYRWVTAALSVAAGIVLWRRFPTRRAAMTLGALAVARRLREPRRSTAIHEDA
jgi:hypothetical protein